MLKYNFFSQYKIGVNTIMDNNETQTETETQQPLAGILLASVESWVDKNGIHPIDEDTGVPDLRKSFTVGYNEIEFIEFTGMMDTKDKALYRVALKEYMPYGQQTRLWT